MTVKNENYLKELISKIQLNETDNVKSVLKKANKNNIILDTNRILINMNGANIIFCPFLEAVKNNNLSMIELLIDYVDNNNLIINVNEKNMEFESPFLLSLKSQKMVEILIDYSNRHNILLNINDKDKSGNNVLLLLINRNKKYVNKFLSTYLINIIHMLIDYANDHNIIMNINEKNENGINPLSLAIIENNINIISILIDYANLHNMILNINEKSENIDSPILLAIKSNDIEIVQMLINYANIHHIILNITNDDLKFIHKINVDILELLSKYVNEHDINLNIMDYRLYNNYNKIKDIIYGNNVEKLKLLINEANNNNVVLNINERYDNINSPLSLAIKNDNIQMVKLLIDYAECHNIGLNITNNDKKPNSKINSEIIYLIEQYNKNRIGKSFSYKNNNKLNSYKLSTNEFQNLPIFHIKTQTPSLSQSELMALLLSQPPNVLISILSQLQSNMQLLQSQSQYHSISQSQLSSPFHIHTQNQTLDNSSSSNTDAPPSYNETFN